jgi:HaeII restriction endonuclease
LDALIAKSRVHLYKPIQIAEILHKARLNPELINISDLSSYRNASKKWRDEVCNKFIGRSSSSSQKYQDNLFEENAIPLSVLYQLDKENRAKNGVVEKYIYLHLQKRLFQIENALTYCLNSDKRSFELEVFIERFYQEAGLKRSIDKIFEIIVYALFETLITSMNVKVDVYLSDEGRKIFSVFPEFCKKVLSFDYPHERITIEAHFNRVGITNAADRGLDMYANFGAVVQIKHLSLDEKLAQDIVGTVSSNRIIIVCKKAEEKVIVSLLNQIGWKGRIQSIITLEELGVWYSRALKGKYTDLLGDRVLNLLSKEIMNEFPMLGKAKEFEEFKISRKYHEIRDCAIWWL